MKETVAQVILNLFMMRPGNYPSLPHIGINIRQYLYKLEEDIDVNELKEKIFTQCSQLLSFISIGEVKAFVVPHEGQALLIVVIPITGLDDDDNALVLGFQQDENNELLFNYQFEREQMFN